MVDLEHIDLTNVDADKLAEVLVDTYNQRKQAGAYTEVFQTYRDPGTRYAFAIMEGQQIAGVDMMLSAFRHLQDLTRIGTPDFPYSYDLQKCHEVLNFAALCPDPDAGKPLPLALWQMAILCWSQGWRNGPERRFHRVIFSVARTNGKTYVTCILLAYQYILGSAGRYNQDMAYIAPVTQQSKKGWRYVKLTFQRLSEMADFNRLFKSQATKAGEDVVKSKKTQNQLLRLSDESGQFDSYHFSFAVHDEAGDDSRVGLISENNGKITSGQVQTEDSQFWNISTAYPDATSSLYKDEKLIHAAMLNDADRKLDDVLLINYAQDSDDEVDQPETWPKSNPILELKGDSMLNSMISERDTKKADGTLSEFINKNLNRWLSVKENRYLNPHDIEQVQGEAPISIFGSVVYIGFDLSKLSDDTAVAFIFPYQVAGETHYYIQQHSWVPTNKTSANIAQKEKMDGINYRQAETLGFATIAKNRWGYVDEDSVLDYIMDYVETNQLQVRFFVFDRWGTSDVTDKLTRLEPFPLMPLKQTADKLDKPTHELQKAFREGRVHTDKDPLLAYALTNAVLVGSSAGLKVDKEKATAKIDAVDAIVDAMSRAIYEFSDFDPDVEEDKSIFAGWSEEQKRDYFTNYSF